VTGGAARTWVVDAAAPRRPMSGQQRAPWPPLEHETVTAYPVCGVVATPQLRALVRELGTGLGPGASQERGFEEDVAGAASPWTPRPPFQVLVSR
jgi:hypothetical protein